MLAALSSFGSWAKKRKRLLAGVVGVAVKSASAFVPGVSLAADVLGQLAEKAIEDILDPESKQPLPREQLAQINDWLATLTQKYGKLLDRLEQLPLADDGTLEQLTQAVEVAIQGQDYLMREFDACLVEVRRQTFALGMIERRLDEHFHVQKRMSVSLDEIEKLLASAPLMSEWAEFRRARPEDVRALNEANDRFLAGRKEDGVAVLAELFKKRGVGKATLARQLGLIEASRGDLASAKEHLREAAQAADVPVLSATLASLSTMSGRSADVWRSLPRGFMVGRKYRIETEIGRGGMASVYRAERVAAFEKERAVAIKVPAPALMRDAITRRRFEQEIAVSRRLSEDRHPHIVRVLEYEIFDDPFTKQEQYALVMELIEGMSLAHYLARRREGKNPLLKLGEVQWVMEAVCSALEHAHGQGVFHRDLKPHNLMVAKGPIVKLMDFGIARVLDDSAGWLTLSGQVVGTLAYLPPELQTGRGTVDARTDVYMAGTLLLELLTGDPAGDPESREDCPKHWLELIAASKHWLPAKRPASIADFRGRLKEQAAPTQPRGSVPEPGRVQVPEPSVKAQEPSQVDEQLDSDREEYQRSASAGKYKDFLTSAAPIRLNAWRAAADRGSPIGQCLFGMCLQAGIGVAPDHVEAVRWFRKAAEQGDAHGQFNLGWMYHNGLGVAQDHVEAFQWFRKAAEQGYASGQMTLGVMYRDGLGVAQDHVEAVRWYRLAAEQGEAQGQYSLGVMYEHGWGVAQDKVEAIRWYRKAADQENAHGQRALGFMYGQGWGVAQDHVEAVRWFRKAADHGDAVGQYNLGVMYRDGLGVAQDHAEAVRWFRKAADQGQSDGQFNLGAMYLHGRGVAQDIEEAVRWYRKAADQGYAHAQAGLGWMYQAGRAVTQDDEEAVGWFRKAAGQGDAHGQFYVGWMYQHGRGVAQDGQEALRWFRLAAEQGNANAGYGIGKLYETGIGVERDTHEALLWYDFAARAGSSEAQQRLEELAGNGPGTLPGQEQDRRGAASATRGPREKPIPLSSQEGPRNITNSIGMKFVLIPAGTFLMGSPKHDKGRRADEGPQHLVEITRPFYLGVTPVTQEQYERVMGSNPSWFSASGGGKKTVRGLDTGAFPVECVSWEEAIDFAKRISALAEEAKSGRSYRLPTEAEWECSCRGGAPTYEVFHFGNSLSSTQAKFDGKYPYGGAAMGPSLKRSCKVGSYPANDFGLFDMHGNVYEWCADWYDANYYAASTKQDPQGPEQASARVLRGGGWGSIGRRCRSAFRSWDEPGRQHEYYGFRLAAVLSLDVKESAQVSGDGVHSLVPGGEAVYDIAKDTLEELQKHQNEAEIRADLERLAQAPQAEVHRNAVEVAANEPLELRLALVSYLDQVPATIRQSLRRPSDPSGKTSPVTLSLKRPEDLLPLLPQNLPRFKPGDTPLPADWELVELLYKGGWIVSPHWRRGALAGAGVWSGAAGAAMGGDPGGAGERASVRGVAG